MHSLPLIANVLFRSFDYPRAPYTPLWIDLKFPELPERRQRGREALALIGGALDAITGNRVR